MKLAPLNANFRAALRALACLPTVLQNIVEEYILPGSALASNRGSPCYHESTDESAVEKILSAAPGTACYTSKRWSAYELVASVIRAHFVVGCSAVMKWYDSHSGTCMDMMTALSAEGVPAESMWPNLVARDERRGVCIRITFLSRKKMPRARLRTAGHWHVRSRFVIPVALAGVGLLVVPPVVINPFVATPASGRARKRKRSELESLRD